MKELVITNHSINLYATRTGRQSNLAFELIQAIKNGTRIPAPSVFERGLTLTKCCKSDTYYIGLTNAFMTNC